MWTTAVMASIFGDYKMTLELHSTCAVLAGGLVSTLKAPEKKE